MSYYPIFLELEGRTALVVGGGSVAQRKVETLLAHGALIRIVSNALTEKLKAMVESGSILHAGDAFSEKHLDGVSLVFAATDDRRLNHEISECARKNGLLINAVDQPADCDFIVPPPASTREICPLPFPHRGKVRPLQKTLECNWNRNSERSMKSSWT